VQAEGDAVTTITIVPESPETPATGYRAFAGEVQSVGKTAGEALDAITAQLGDAARGTLLVVHHPRPDAFFTADQQQRLEELMTRWRTARDAGATLRPEEQAELDALVEAELRGAAARAAALVRGLAP
jgi:hypothetical protein